jgi:hypothetical protein
MSPAPSSLIGNDTPLMERRRLHGSQWGVICSPYAPFEARYFSMVGHTNPHRFSIQNDLQQGLSASSQGNGVLDMTGSHIVIKSSVACEMGIASRVMHTRAHVLALCGEGSTDYGGCLGSGRDGSW